MSETRFILRSFGLFFSYKPIRLILLFLNMLFLGFTQGVTIVLLVPLISLLEPSQPAISSSRFADFANTIFSKLGVEANLTFILIVFAICLISIAVLNYFKATVQAAYQQEFSFHIRKRLFKKLITCDWSFLNGKSKHSHIQALTVEIPKMTTYYYFYLGISTKLIFIITHVLFAVIISAKFTGFVVISALLLFVFLRKYLKTAIQLGAGNILSFQKMLKQIDDFWQTVKVAKVHNSEEFYYEKYQDSNNQVLEYRFRQLKNRAIPQLLFTIAGVGILIIVVLLAFHYTQLPMASLFVLILLFARIFPQFNGLNNDLNMLVSNVASVKVVLNMDRDMPESKFCRKETGMPQIWKKVEIKNLHFSYDSDRPIFNNFSTTIRAKEMTGVFGKSGCGKTTFIDILAGLQNTEIGVLVLDGKNMEATDLASWKNSLSYLPQDSFFVDETIRENLIWDSGQKPTDEQLWEILKMVRADKLVKYQKLGLDTNITNYEHHFSGGERQRLALARVLIRKPKLLLLDEATSALDSETESQIMESLVNMKKDMTIVFVTHRQTLKSYFDRIIDLDEM